MANQNDKKRGSNDRSDQDRNQSNEIEGGSNRTTMTEQDEKQSTEKNEMDEDSNRDNFANDRE